MPLIPSRRQIVATLAALSPTACIRAAFAAAEAEAEPKGPSVAERLAGYAEALTFDDLDPGTVEVAKIRIVDALGCLAAGLNEGPVRICREVALAASGGPSLVIGTDRRVSPDRAAFANGVALRYFDMNDYYTGKEPGHPSDAIAPCLAVAEAEGRGGQDLLLSVVLAYEVTCRLLDGAAITPRGWDHPLFSLPAVALAAGRLMRLDAGKLTQAVNLAINGHVPMNQTRVQQLSDWKGVADAEAARNAVFAAELARGGLTGPAPIFEGTAGLFRLVSGSFDVKVDEFGGRRGSFKINDCNSKFYPSQGYTLTAIPAAVEVAREAGNLDRIGAIEIATTQAGYVTAGRDREKWAPQTRETADHSLPYVVARAMLDGDITHESFATDKVRDPRARALMAKTKVVEDPALTALMPKGVPNRVTARLTDGQTITRQVDDLPGFAGRAMQRSDAERKFVKDATGRWGESRSRRILDAVWSLDSAADLRGFTALLGPTD